MNIYKLTFNNSLHYIGQTKHDYDYRATQHINALEGGYHKNKKMQQAFFDSGYPEVSLIETVETSEQANEREIHWVQYYNSYVCGINQTRGGDNNSYIGEESHNAQHVKDDYVAVYWFLAHTNMTFQEIGKELDISYAIVQSINYGKAHQYLQTLMPIEFGLIQLKHGKRNFIRTTYPLVKSPEGQVYEINNCNEFCRIHGLDAPNLRTVLNGKRKSHKGWTLADDTLRVKLQKPEIAKVLSPSGEEHIVRDSKKFAEEHFLHKSSFARLLSGEFKQHKGWTKL